MWMSSPAPCQMPALSSEAREVSMRVGAVREETRLRKIEI